MRGRREDLAGPGGGERKRRNERKDSETFFKITSIKRREYSEVKGKNNNKKKTIITGEDLSKGWKKLNKTKK